MLRSWKAFSLALIAALGAVMLLTASPGSPEVRQVFAAAEQITVDVTGGGESNADFDIEGCDENAIDLDSTDAPETVPCDPGSVTITLATPPAGFELDDIDCDVDDDGPTVGEDSDINIDVNDGEVSLTLEDDEHIVCVFEFVAASPTTTATVTATATGTVTVSTLTVTAAPATLGCSGSAFVTVVARNAAGQVVAAGNVTLSTTLGTLTPTNAVDTGAGVLAVLTAPSNQGGTAKVTATAGGATGSVDIPITCAQATATSVPPTAAPQAPIVPPSTGDGGLERGSDWQSIAGFTMLGIALAGAMALGWKRARA
jgi:hypothetical protein